MGETGPEVTEINAVQIQYIGDMETSSVGKKTECMLELLCLET
jgi:hypothetical protein